MPKNASLQTDVEMVQRAASGERTAFEAIVKRYSRPLSEFAAVKTNTIQDAEDIVQETFLRAYLNLNAFDTRYSLKNWLFTIAYRLIISGYRKKQMRTVDNGTLLSVADTPEKTAASMDWVWETAMEMGEPIHTILWLRYKQDMDISQIAAVMNKSKIGVRVLLHRARRRLAERIESLAEEDRSGVWIPQRPFVIERTKP